MARILRAIHNLFMQRPQREEACDGYVYVPRDEQAVHFAQIGPGVQVGSFIDRPPWIVVDHSPKSVVAAKWPGTLWSVRILGRAASQPYAYAGYTRATAVRVLKEIGCGHLFEHDGDSVVSFLDQIESITENEVRRLGRVEDEEADRLFSAVWDRWLSVIDPASSLIGGDHSGILQIGSKSPGSPVGRAPSILHSLLLQRAREIDGDGAFVEDDNVLSFNPEWERVAKCAQNALFSVGVDETFLSPHEREVLGRAFRRKTP
jgi:hypothetical protein